MATSRILTGALVLLLISSITALAWAARTTLALGEDDGEIRVETDDDTYENGETILIRVRNIGDTTVTGAPRVLVLNEQGGIQQHFAFGDFLLELEPQESVWVEWKTRPHAPDPCVYGRADASDAPQGASHPCPMPGGALEGAPEPGVRCYPCPPYYPGLNGKFVVVGVFGSFADAAVITIG